MAFDEPEQKRPVGRPSDYDPAYCETVVRLGAEGKSKVEIAFDLGVGRTTIQRWEAAHEDFRVAMTRAKDAEQAWWERKGRENLGAQHFQASMWGRSMGARFPDDWREASKQELTGPNNAPLVPVINVSVGRDQSKPSS